MLRQWSRKCVRVRVWVGGGGARSKRREACTCFSVHHAACHPRYFTALRTVLCIQGTRRSEDLWRDFTGNREIRGIVAVFISTRRAAPRRAAPRRSVRRVVSLRPLGNSCQSNWLRRATKILRCSSPLRGHLHAGDINQCRVFRVPPSRLVSSRLVFSSLSSVPPLSLLSICSRLALLSSLPFYFLSILK